MPRELLEQELQTLLSDLLAMGALVERAIYKASQSLEDRDKRRAQEVVEEDNAINEARWGLEEECYRLLATQQPMATDLRTVAAVLSVVSDIERIGDHARGIARIVLRMVDQPLLEPSSSILRMSKKCQADLQLVLRGFINRDEGLARWVCSEDNAVDTAYRGVLSELLRIMVDDPRTINRATYHIWVAHKLERIHDRITNIGERVIFMVTGRMEELNV